MSMIVDTCVTMFLINSSIIGWNAVFLSMENVCFDLIMLGWNRNLSFKGVKIFCDWLKMNIKNIYYRAIINLFVPNAPFLYPRYGFLMFSGDSERVHWEQMGHWKFLRFWKKTFQGVANNKEPLIFWKYPRGFTESAITSCFYLKSPAEISLRYVRFTKLCRMSKPI